MCDPSTTHGIAIAHFCVAQRQGVSIEIQHTTFFFKLIYYTDSIYKMYKDKLQNCFCNQFHNISTYKQVETNSMTRNRGGNNGSEK